jgi:hypothetical protein
LIKILTKIKSQMHPSDAAKQPTHYNLEEFVSPDRDTSIDLSADVAQAPAQAPPATPPAPPSPARTPAAAEEEYRVPRKRRRRPSYQRGPSWMDRLWLLLGIVIILALLGFVGYRVVRHFTHEELPANELLRLGMEAEKQRNYAQARQYYETILRTYRRSPQGDVAAERRSKLTQKQAWSNLRTSMWLLEMDCKQAGKYDAARDILDFIEKYWPEEQDKQALEDERKKLDELQNIQQGLSSQEEATPPASPPSP